MALVGSCLRGSAEDQDIVLWFFEKLCSPVILMVHFLLGPNREQGRRGGVRGSMKAFGIGTPGRRALKFLPAQEAGGNKPSSLLPRGLALPKATQQFRHEPAARCGPPDLWASAFQLLRFAGPQARGA